MDAFYASVEQRDFPQYRGKPIVVGGSPEGRGVLATASYEARKYGLRSAMPSAHAIKLCPHVIFVRPRFEAYKEVSRQIREIFFDYTDLVEPLSLDEAYLDVTENKIDLPSATLIAKEIRKRIQNETELTTSAGVAFNKFLAKVASDVNKPNGIKVITPDIADNFIKQLSIGKFYGIGRVTEEKMKRLGIENGSDLQTWEEYDLVKHFGKAGRFYYAICRGEDNREVKTDRKRKSVGAEHTFENDLIDYLEIDTWLKEIAQKVSLRLKKQEIKARTVTLKVRYDNFETITRSQTLPSYVNDESLLYTVTKTMIEETEADHRPVRLLGISTSNLDNQTDMFGEQLELSFNK